MQDTLVRDLKASVGNGQRPRWLHKRRDLGGIVFVGAGSQWSGAGGDSRR